MKRFTFLTIVAVAAVALFAFFASAGELPPNSEVNQQMLAIGHQGVPNAGELANLEQPTEANMVLNAAEVHQATLEDAIDETKDAEALNAVKATHLDLSGFAEEEVGHFAGTKSLAMQDDQLKNQRSHATMTAIGENSQIGTSKNVIECDALVGNLGPYYRLEVGTFRTIPAVLRNLTDDAALATTA